MHLGGCSYKTASDLIIRNLIVHINATHGHLVTWLDRLDQCLSQTRMLVGHALPNATHYQLLSKIWSQSAEGQDGGKAKRQPSGAYPGALCSDK